jgi:hypothetical protein
MRTLLLLLLLLFFAAIACSGNPCGKIQFAVNGSCSASTRRAGVQQQQQLNYTCACVPRYTWSEGACVGEWT